jgi:hypothetical protein
VRKWFKLGKKQQIGKPMNKLEIDPILRNYFNAIRVEFEKRLR